MPARRRRKGCAVDKGYDYPEVHALVDELGFTPHIRSRGEEKQELERDAGFRPRRWVVERTHAWLNRFRGLLIRWCKKPDNNRPCSNSPAESSLGDSQPPKAYRDRFQGPSSLTPGDHDMKLLLTSAGIKNTSIHDVPLELLGKPIAESDALCIPTALYGHPMAGPRQASRFMTARIGADFVNWHSPAGDRTLGVVDFSIFPHVENPDPLENTMGAAERWAAGVSGPACAIDDETAIKVVDGTVEVVSEGNWKLLTPNPEAS